MLSTKKQKTSNTNNSAQVNLINERSSNNRITIASNRILMRNTQDNNITFDNLNYEHTPV